MLGLTITKRTCHFLMNSTAIWRPDNITQLLKFESIQKNAIKWILNEEFLSFSDDEVYVRKCKEVNLLPIFKLFDLRDLVLFHKIVNKYIPTNLPNYISRDNGSSRLRDNHLDSECYVCNLDNNAVITVVSHIYTYDRAKTHSFILLIRRKSTEFENESNV